MLTEGSLQNRQDTQHVDMLTALFWSFLIEDWGVILLVLQLCYLCGDGDGDPSSQSRLMSSTTTLVSVNQVCRPKHICAASHLSSQLSLHWIPSLF